MTRWAVHFWLFALALHPILVYLADAFPSIQIFAYADNAIISGPLIDMKHAIGDMIYNVKHPELEAEFTWLRLLCIFFVGLLNQMV